MSCASYGFYGDDFTGATDTLAHLSRAGLRTLLFVEPPTPERLATVDALDAIGMAGAARALAPHAMRAQLQRVGERFAALGVRVMHYKVCSTFDSAPQVGNIATAIDTLRAYFRNPFVPIVGGQPNLGRYCAFGNLFATAGDGRAYRIDRHPTMSRHPATPMLEADLGLHFERLGIRVRKLDWRAFAWPDASFDDALDALDAPDDAPILLDVLDDSHLRRIGEAMRIRAERAPLLAVGASSVAQAWAMSSASSAPRDACETPALGAALSPVFVLAGSLSPATEAQIGAARDFVRIELDPAAMCDPSASAYRSAKCGEAVARLRAGRHVLAYTSRARAAVSSEGEALARACATLLRDVVAGAAPRRVGIAGGDTSSFGVQALRPWGLSYLGTLSAGVTVCRVHADDPRTDGIELMLKGGQMGDADIFNSVVTGTRR